MTPIVHLSFVSAATIPSGEKCSKWLRSLFEWNQNQNSLDNCKEEHAGHTTSAVKFPDGNYSCREEDKDLQPLGHHLLGWLQTARCWSYHHHYQPHYLNGGALPMILIQAISRLWHHQSWPTSAHTHTHTHKRMWRQHLSDRSYSHNVLRHTQELSVCAWLVKYTVQNIFTDHDSGGCSGNIPVNCDIITHNSLFR